MRRINKRHIIIALSLLVLILTIVLLGSRKFEPNVLSVSPSNGSKEVSLNTQIDIIFEDSVPEIEQSKFFVRIIPGVPTDTVWISPKLLRLIPKADLSSQTLYKITILFDGKEIHASSFETKYIKVYTNEEIEELRNMALETSAAFYQLDETYPFLRKLPLESDSYRVVFDFDRDEFRLRLKMPSTAPEATRQEAEQAALSDLNSAGINVTQYGYYILYSE